MTDEMSLFYYVVMYRKVGGTDRLATGGREPVSLARHSLDISVSPIINTGLLNVHF